MTKPYSKNEPARQLSYRRVYIRIKRWQEEIEDSVSGLYKIVNELRERVRKIEVVIKKMGESD